MYINEIVVRCLNLSDEKLLELATENYKKVWDYIESLKNVQDPKAQKTILIGTVFTCVATDGKLSDKEYRFILQVVGDYSRDEAIKLVEDFNCEETRTVMRDFVRKLPEEIKEAYVALCVATLACDKRLKNKELKFLSFICS